MIKFMSGSISNATAAVSLSNVTTLKVQKLDPEVGELRE
jgi:hypothetical protein